jgi:hypothetical protein
MHLYSEQEKVAIFMICLSHLFSGHHQSIKCNHQTRNLIIVAKTYWNTSKPANHNFAPRTLIKLTTPAICYAAITAFFFIPTPTEYILFEKIK